MADRFMIHVINTGMHTFSDHDAHTHIRSGLLFTFVHIYERFALSFNERPLAFWTF